MTQVILIIALILLLLSIFDVIYFYDSERHIDDLLHFQGD